MRATLWGVRGSVPVPGPAVAEFGGNTTCVEIAAGDGTELILDAGTGIRELGSAISSRGGRYEILLTHLHLDHIQGLMFFTPFFDPEAEVTVWGPPGAGRSLEERLARYISAPLSPIEIRDLAARVRFVDAPVTPWRIGDVEIRASLVAHRGPTLGYRLSEGDVSLAFLPDHEPGLGANLDREPGTWISGHELAKGATLLVHDCQYGDAEYSGRRGWGHSRITDALAFAHRCEPERVAFFHHDPAHDDSRLDALEREAAERWSELGNGAAIDLAREGSVLEIG